MATCGITIEYGADEDSPIAALLQDAVDDQGGEATRTEIGYRFGQRVARIILGCSSLAGKSELQYIEHLEHAVADEALVSASDKLHNSSCAVGSKCAA